jgi:hypothetical protein
MSKKKATIRRGFTIIEVMLAAALAIIVILGIGVVLVDSQRGWNRMYDRIYADVVSDSFVARKMFDSIVRKASREQILIDDAGGWVEVYYYAGSGSTDLDRYARFFLVDDQLHVEHGKVEPRETLNVYTVCENVSSCVFKASGRSIQMILTLDNGSQTASVVTSAVMHNQ